MKDANVIDGEWDVILIGAGQNNFALGTYLGKAGLRTVICESRLENGGRLASEELTLPGYWHNTLAYFQDNRALSPVWKDLDWENGHHADFISPPVISALLLPGGSSVACSRSVADTVASIGRLSQRDALAWRRTYDTYAPLIREFLIPYYYTGPEGGAALLAKLRSAPGGEEFLRLWRMTPRQAVDRLFENDAVKTLVLSQMAIPRGVAVDYEGAGVEVLKFIAGDEQPELARGGSHSIAQVLQRAYVRAGGQIRAMHHVETVLVEDGRAAGVRLRDGREWKARLAVVSSADPYSTFIEMIGETHLPPSLCRDLKDMEYDEFSWFQLHLALKAPVRYALHEAIDPAIKQAMNVNMGPERPSHLDEMWSEIRAGELPQRLSLHATCPTALDPLQAPSGKHAASVYLPVPFELKGKRPDSWTKLKKNFASIVLSLWRRYATNLTDDNIETAVALDPFYLAGRWPNMRRGSVWVARKSAKQMGAARPTEALANYRTPVRGLYLVGAGTHPADAVIAGAGYNCWHVMRRDLSLG